MGGKRDQGSGSQNIAARGHGSLHFEDVNAGRESGQLSLGRGEESMKTTRWIEAGSVPMPSPRASQMRWRRSTLGTAPSRSSA